MLLSDILARAGKVKVRDAKLAPLGEMEDGEKVVGVLPEDLKGLFGVMQESQLQLVTTHENLEARISKLRGKMTKDEAESIQHEHAVAHCEADFIRQCFWTSVRMAFPQLVSEPAIGLRKNWQVVTSVPDGVCAVEVIEIGMLAGGLSGLFRR